MTMKQWSILIAGLIMLHITSSYTPVADLITQADVSRINATLRPGMPETDILNIKFPVNSNTSLKGTFSITSKGNGVLTISGLNIRIYDAHSDGIIFADYLLHNEATDIDQDGYNDLVVWGTAILSDEEEREITRVPVKAIFRFNPKTMKLENTLKDKHIYVF
jgi:hypothetical protein